MRSSFLYFKQAHDELLKLLALPVRTYNQETYHDVRVCVKKIFALIEMIKFYNIDIDKKDNSGLLKIFRHAGIVRTLYIDREITKKYSKCKDTANMNIFDSKIENEKAKLGCIIENKKDNVINLKSSIIDKILNIDRIETNRFVKHKKMLVLKTLKKALKDTSMLHSLRKHMKYFSYILQSLNKKAYTDIIETLDSITSQIGKWHDLDENEKNSRITLKKYPKTSQIMQKTIDQAHTEAGRIQNKILSELRSVQVILKRTVVI